MNVISNEQHKQKMQRRKEVQDQRLAEKKAEKGLIIVNTGNGKGKTTAALGMVMRSLGHGYKVAIVQFINAMGEGFTWETQDRERDMEKAATAWSTSLEYILNPEYRLVLLDEVNIALKLGYLDVDTVIEGLSQKPEDSHVILTGRGAPEPLIAIADLVTEMSLIKHPFREQGVKAQPGIEY